MNKKEMQAIIERLEAEKASLKAEIDAVKVQVTKVRKTRKKTISGLLDALQDANRKNEKNKARPKIDQGKKTTVMALASDFHEWCKAQNRASAYKSFLKGDKTLGVAAMVTMFEHYLNYRQLPSIENIAVSIGCHQKSIYNHFNKVNAFLSTLNK